MEIFAHFALLAALRFSGIMRDFLLKYFKEALINSSKGALLLELPWQEIF